jgi:hypothetical protein
MKYFPPPHDDAQAYGEQISKLIGVPDSKPHNDLTSVINDLANQPRSPSFSTVLFDLG